MCSLDDVVPEFVSFWANQLRCDVDTIRKLSGGINSNVYCCSNQEGQWVIKSYATHQSTQSIRMKAEVDFLEYASKVAPGYTPKVRYQDAYRNCIVMEMLDGEPFKPSEVVSEQVAEEGLRFLRKLNSDRSVARQNIHFQAAEGYLRISDHIVNTQARLSRLRVSHISSQTQGKARELVSYTNEALRRAREQFDEFRQKGIVRNRISEDLLYVSPSDFGFHNAIRSNDVVYFIDFEFAGWDDPAKTIIDFILQPKCPVSIDLDRLIAIYPELDSKTLRKRCEILFPILRTKWLCIILSVLDPLRLKSLGEGTETNSLVLNRLSTAEEFIYRSSTCVDYRLSKTLR